MIMQLEVHHLAFNMRTRCHFKIQHFPSPMKLSCYNCVLNLKIRSYSLTKFEVTVVSAFSQYEHFFFSLFFSVEG